MALTKTGAPVEGLRVDLESTTAGGGADLVANVAKVFNVISYGAVGDGTTNDRDNVAAAFAAAASAGGGVIYFPYGTYLMEANNKISLTSNLYITGDPGTIILQAAADTRPMWQADSGSSDPDANIANITIDGLIFKNTVGTFSEFVHLVGVTGVTNFTVRGCQFIGFRGDGLYIGAGITGAEERHNRNILIENNLFDGVNNENRNGVSVIDGDGVTIRNNEFWNCTRSNMPGPIDFEPGTGQTYAIIRNILVENNRIYNAGGDFGIVFHLNATTGMTTPPSNITIRGNFIDADTTLMGGAAFQFNYAYATVSSTTELTNLKIVDNFSRAVGPPFYIEGVKGAEISGNTFENAANSTIGSLTDDTLRTRDVYVGNNVFAGPGVSLGMLLYGAVDRLTLDGNKFYPTAAMAGTVLIRAYGGTTTSTSVRFTRNEVTKGASSVTTWIAATNHTFPSASYADVCNWWAKDNVATDGTLGFSSAFTSYGETKITSVPSYDNSFTGSATYYRDETGTVFLDGIIATGAAGAAAFTLPAGYRPASTQYLVVNGQNTFAYITINTAGVVTPSGGTGVDWRLTSAKFKAVVVATP